MEIKGFCVLAPMKRTYGPTGKMFVVFQRFVDRVEKRFIGNVSDVETSVVEMAENTGSILFD